MASPDLGELEERYVLDALRSTWISSSGPYLARFEALFAEMCGTRAAIAVTNGTVALHLALLGLGVRPGDEVIVPSLTYVATANAVRYVGAEPVFVDVDPATWCIDPAKVEDAITARTRGIIPVHLYGHPCDMERLNHLAAVHGLWVVEDAAEAHTAQYKGRPVGGLGAIGTFSFYGNKIFTSGEGGALVLDDPHLEKRLRTLRGQGMDPERRYYFPITGYNFRMTNLTCAILTAQLERREEILARRRAIARAYNARLGAVPGLVLPPHAPWAEPVCWLYSVCVDPARFGRSRDQLAAHLASHGVETRRFFIPLHTLPPFREGSRRRGEVLPVTEQLAREGLNLPTFGAMSDDDIAYVCDHIAELAGHP